MKPTFGDPFVWVDGHKYDFSDPAFIRARCRCGEVADFRVLFMGERGPVIGMGIETTAPARSAGPLHA